MGIQGVRAPRGSPIFLDQTESRRAEKNLFRDRPPYLRVGRVGMTAPPPPLYDGLETPLVLANVTNRHYYKDLVYNQPS